MTSLHYLNFFYKDTFTSPAQLVFRAIMWKKTSLFYVNFVLSAVLNIKLFVYIVFHEINLFRFMKIMMVLIYFYLLSKHIKN